MFVLIVAPLLRHKTSIRFYDYRFFSAICVPLCLIAIVIIVIYVIYVYLWQTDKIA